MSRTFLFFFAQASEKMPTCRTPYASFFFSSSSRVLFDLPQLFGLIAFHNAPSIHREVFFGFPRLGGRLQKERRRMNPYNTPGLIPNQQTLTEYIERYGPHGEDRLSAFPYHASGL